MRDKGVLEMLIRGGEEELALVRRTATSREPNGDRKVGGGKLV